MQRVIADIRGQGPADQMPKDMGAATSWSISAVMAKQALEEHIFPSAERIENPIRDDSFHADPPRTLYDYSFKDHEEFFDRFMSYDEMFSLWEDKASELAEEGALAEETLFPPIRTNLDYMEGTIPGIWTPHLMTVKDPWFFLYSDNRPTNMGLWPWHRAHVIRFYDGNVEKSTLVPTERDSLEEMIGMNFDGSPDTFTRQEGIVGRLYQGVVTGRPVLQGGTMGTHLASGFKWDDPYIPTLDGKLQGIWGYWYREDPDFWRTNMVYQSVRLNLGLLPLSPRAHYLNRAQFKSYRPVLMASYKTDYTKNPNRISVSREELKTMFDRVEFDLAWRDISEEWLGRPKTLPGDNILADRVANNYIVYPTLTLLPLNLSEAIRFVKDEFEFSKDLIRSNTVRLPGYGRHNECWEFFPLERPDRKPMVLYEQVR